MTKGGLIVMERINDGYRQVAQRTDSAERQPCEPSFYEAQPSEQNTTRGDSE